MDRLYNMQHVFYIRSTYESLFRKLKGKRRWDQLMYVLKNWGEMVWAAPVTGSGARANEPSF
jgi:hypothetical protein